MIALRGKWLAMGDPNQYRAYNSLVPDIPAQGSIKALLNTPPKPLAEIQSKRK